MGVILRAHPVRGESHIERNTKRLNLGCGAGAQIKTEKEPKLSLEFRTGTGDMAIWGVAPGPLLDTNDFAE